MAKPVEVDEQWLGRIAEQVNGLEYGEVNIVVHDGRIVQIERKERKRYDDSTRIVKLQEQKEA
ncbi:YezD family protein [Cohnella sp. WQ 127256]|uniref:YezD family protein n=1 Tax=Cohnella sp. WQ 127256 TaxID=2938790 RepID=UPI0021191629|nr:YezD family protein [Cohnella sp. WQ 127256]